ncbi:hypothetical protein SSX86_032848 [Deinandra increscens subsp. villosa]|uniref:CCHC-type domain-containing protein n=1 Tax=Deinandra increscens subsp. villosa TaxID=3103831 RepID=A0AAP0C6U9_9ASTR
MVLCFVEFTEPNHALTALEALQGYKFDYKKPDSPALRIHFAHFPFQLPPDDARLSSQPRHNNAHFPSQPPPDSARFPSQQSPTSARFPSQQSPTSPHFSSQPPSTSAHFSSRLLPDSAVYPSKLPNDSSRFSSQLPQSSARFPSQLPQNSAHYPSQVPLSSAHSSFEPPPHREEQDLAIPRVKELAVEDEEPVVMSKKFKHGPSQKKEKAEDLKSKKKWCIKCKQNHFGECYNFKNCYICGKPGHIGKECTSKPRLCYGCGEPGHIHSLCPNGPRPEKKGNGSGTFLKKKGPPET